MYSNVAGEHENTFSINRTASACQAVCCCADYIFVAGSRFRATVHIYSWTGRRIKTLSPEQLGAEWKSDILAIQCNHDGTVLQLVTENIKDDIFCDHSLCAYKVSDDRP